MRRMFATLLVLCTMGGAFAQEKTGATALAESKTFDNFYIGLNGGVSVMPFYTNLHRHINPNAGLRIGRYFTPVFGVAVEGNAYFDDRPWNTIGNVVKYVNTGALATINFSNWFGGYGYRPRLVEVEGEFGLGWGHAFGHQRQQHARQNDVTSKTGVLVGFNLGKQRAWKVYLEPAMTWNILDGGARNEGVQYNYKKSFLQLNVGACFHFRNSNGTHHFKRIALEDPQTEFLRSQVKNLLVELDSTIHVLGDVEFELNQKDRLLESLQQAGDSTLSPASAAMLAEAIQKTDKILPVMLVFKEGSTEIGESQLPSVELVANYLKQHPDVSVEIRGHATRDADILGFSNLAEARAGSVKYTLVKTFGIEAERISIAAGRVTNELYDQPEFNRIVTFKVVR